MLRYTSIIRDRTHFFGTRRQATAAIAAGRPSRQGHGPAAMAGGTRWGRGTTLALGASLLLNAAFLASFLARGPALPVPVELAELRDVAGAPSSAAGATLGHAGTTQLADMYTAPLHLMKSLIDNALQGAGFTGKKAKAKMEKFLHPRRQRTQLSADSSTASKNKELTEHKVVESTGAFFDPSIKAFVNPLLLPHLAEMNELQVKVSAHKLAALKSADQQIAQPTSGGMPVAPREPSLNALFQWGTVNPVNAVMRLDCTDSVMDASSNGARMNRLWGTQYTQGDFVDACGPGDDCRDPCAYQMCNEHHSYTVECPPGCAARAGPVFGAGTSDNPFLDASSVCGAALAQGIARDDAPTLVTLKIIAPVRAYKGVTLPSSPLYQGSALAALRLLEEKAELGVAGKGALQDSADGARRRYVCVCVYVCVRVYTHIYVYIYTYI
jgi:hypothetical protein